MKNITRIIASLTAAAAVGVGVASPATAQSSLPQWDAAYFQNMIPSPAGIPRSSAPVPPAPKSTAEEAHTEAETVRLLNQQRVSRGLRPLVVDPVLSAQAKIWATEMANGGPWTGSPHHRGTQSVFVSNYATADTLVNAWKEHQVTTRPQLTRVGVGVVIKNGSTYANIQAR